MSDNAATLAGLQGQLDALRLQQQIAVVESQLRAANLAGSLVLNEAAWGDPVDRYEYRYDTPGWEQGSARTAYRDDRRDGRYKPFFETENDLLDIWGCARWLSGSEEVGAGGLEALTNYTIGTGFTYTTKSKDKGVAENLAAACQAIVDEFIERNEWEGDLERELFQRLPVDGEFALWVKDAGHGLATVRAVDAECITEPANARQLEEYYGLDSYCWSFGVATEHGNSARRHGYFVQWYGDPNDWEYVPACEMVHARINVPRSVKRGLSDYFPCFGLLTDAPKLADNMTKGGAIQAAIAFIREHATGTSTSQIESFRQGQATSFGQRPGPNGGTQQTIRRKYHPGTVLDIAAGLKYLPGPLGTANATAPVAILQAALRLIGVRWQMPEYMISGDASNANYSSTLVAGSPFVKATENRQAYVKRPFSRVFWRVLDIAVRAGRLAKFGIYTLAELKRAIELDITPPSVEIGNPKEQEEIADMQQKAGILSPRTRAERAGLEYDNEVANGAKEQEPTSPISLVHPGQDQQQQPVKPAIDTNGLNGAQITAAVDVLAKLQAGTVAELVAVELLSAVGIDQATANRMVSAQKKVAKPIEQSQPAVPPQKPVMESLWRGYP